METTKEAWVPHGGPEIETLAILQQATRAYGARLLLATSLGPQSLAIIDLACRHDLRFDVALIDTGLLFAETLRLAEEVEDRYTIRIRRARPSHSVEEQEALEGAKLWSRDPGRCCQLRKVEPMRDLLSGYSAWITGLRRDQSTERAETRAIEWDEHFGLVKLSPLVEWSREQVSRYLQDNQVPSNPLLSEGYSSIGCAPCTQRSHGTSERAGRWAGQQKTECGLHTRLVPLRNATQD